jgi:hypothetical protein
VVIHRAACGVAVERIGARGAQATLRATKAADILSVLSLPATWRTFGQEYAWTYDEIQAWIVEPATRLIIDRSPASRRNVRHTSKRSRP